MDANLAAGTIGGVSVAAIFGVIAVIYKAINHTACRSRCCGKSVDASIDIGTSPYATAPVISPTKSTPLLLPTTPSP